MTLNRQRLLRYAEYAAVSASVAGVIASVATRQLVYGVAPLSAAVALNLVNRRQWEQQIEQRLTQTTSQIGQRFDDLVEQHRQLEQRLRDLPDITVENFAQTGDLQALREERSQLFQQLSDDLQVLRQNLAQQDRRQWEQQIEQRLTQTTTQIGQRFQALVQQHRQLEQRLRDLPDITVENLAQIGDLQTLREDNSRLFQQLSDDLQILRQNLDQQKRGVDRSELDVITADLRQLKIILAALESLNFDGRLQELEQQAVGEPIDVEAVIAPLRTNLDQLRNDVRQLQADLAGLRALPPKSPSTSTVSPPYRGAPEPPEEIPSDPEFQWQPPQLPSNQNFDLELNLGIDFGTGFTKVCFRNLDSDYSEIVTFVDPDESDVQLDQSLLSTEIAILEDGTLLSGLTAAEWASKTQPIQKTVEFMKMRLAHLDTQENDDWRLEQMPELDDPETVENLCAYYLSKVIARSQHWIQHHRADLFKDRIARWSVNIGVPVQYCNTDVQKRFERVLALAWLMAHSPSSKSSFSIHSLSHFGRYIRQWWEQNLDGNLDCFTTPEISAAVWSFLSNQNIPERFYTVFDVGDGTLDGAAFRFWREDGEPRIDFYSGYVTPLGVTAFSQQVGREINVSPSQIKQSIIRWESATQQQNFYQKLITSETRRKIQKHVGKVIVKGRTKHRDNRNILHREELGDELYIFLSGGGGENPFFGQTIESTYEDFNQASADLPPYHVRNLPIPSNLEMNGLDKSEFRRFSVAYGLCIPKGEGPDIRLPDQIERHESSARWYRQVPRYEDTKDLM